MGERKRESYKSFRRSWITRLQKPLQTYENVQQQREGKGGGDGRRRGDDGDGDGGDGGYNNLTYRKTKVVLQRIKTSKTE